MRFKSLQVIDLRAFLLIFFFLGWAFASLDEVMEKAEKFAAVTHNHPEGIKEAQVTSGAIYLARKGATKNQIREFVVGKFGYDLTRTIDVIRTDYKFDVSCQGSVPQAITAFLESMDFEDAIRNAISIGGDSDTIACIAGGIAEAFYEEVPREISEVVTMYLPQEMRGTIKAFYKRFA